MALEKGKLTGVIRVGAGQTVGIITCADNKKVYVKSIVCHSPNASGFNTSTAHVYLVPNGGSPDDTNKIFHTDVSVFETVLLEPAYPFVLDTTGESIFVGTGDYAGVGVTHINVIINGDREV